MFVPSRLDQLWTYTRRKSKMVRSSCCSKEGLKQGAWTAEEDMILSEYVRIHGVGGWGDLPKKAGLQRRGKSCRLRWLNYLRPDIKRGNISPDEEELIIRMHRLLGNRWSLIAGRLPGRTDNEIKNYWNTHLGKKLSVNESQCNSSTQSLNNRSSKSPALQENHVIKTHPLKITTAVLKQAEMVRPYPCSNRSSSKSECDLLVNDPIEDNDSGHIAFTRPDVNLVETEIRSSTCKMSDQHCPPSDHFVGDAATSSESLLYLNEPLSPLWNLLLSTSHCSTDYGVEEFDREQPPLAAATNDLEDIFSHQSNTQPVNNLSVADHQWMEELHDNYVQRKDWILNPDYF